MGTDRIAPLLAGKLFQLAYGPGLGHNDGISRCRDFTESCCVNAGIATNSSRTRSNSFIVVLKCAKFTSKFVPIGIICVNLYYDNDIPMAIDSIG